MAALFFTFYESDSFRKEPHRPHQRRIFIRISLQDFIGRDESGEGAIGFGECVFGERIIGLHDATTKDYDIWFEYNTEIPDSSLQFKTDFPDECSGVWIFFFKFFILFFINIFLLFLTRNTVTNNLVILWCNADIYWVCMTF